jgi:hypothetical protein
MKKNLIMYATICLLASGCSKKQTDTAESENTAPVAEVSNEAPEITLIEMKGEKIGFTIQAPEGSKELQNEDYMWTTSLVFPDRMSEINVSVRIVVGELNSMQDAFKYTNSDGGKSNAKEQKAVGADFLIVKEPIGTVLQDFWYFAKAKEGFIAVKCTAPPSQQEVCLKIVTSLKSI